MAAADWACCILQGEMALFYAERDVEEFWDMTILDILLEIWKEVKMYVNGFTGETDEGETTLTCPDCGCEMHLIDTRKGRFYSCEGFPKCRVTHGCHPDGSPLGVPGDRETRDARMRAHDVFDLLWKSGKMSRHKVYRKLAGYLRMDEEDCHIGMFTKEQCERVEFFARRVCELHGIAPEAKVDE